MTQDFQRLDLAICPQTNEPAVIRSVGVTDEMHNEGGIPVVSFYGCGSVNFFMHDVKPIPLTEEFFEKNGVKKVDYDYLKPNAMFESEDMRIRVTDLTNSGEGYWNVHIDNEYFETIGSCDVKYVHQFQQLFRLCGYEMDVVV